MVNFLLWKQSLDPTRFAHYHPKLAPVLHKISLARSSPTLTQQVMPPTTTTSTGGSASPGADVSGDLRAAEPDPAGQSGAEHAPDGRRDGRMGDTQGSLWPSRRVTAARSVGPSSGLPRLW